MNLRNRIVTLAMSGLITFSLLVNGTAAGASPTIQIAPSQLALSATPVGSAGATRIDIISRTGSLPSSLEVHVNGKDESDKMLAGTCQGQPCMTGTLSLNDGLYSGKNVVGAIGKSSNGQMLSGRLRFSLPSSAVAAGSVGVTGPVLKAATTAVSSVAAPAVKAAGVATPILPPTVSLATNYAGGYDYGGNSWITVGQTEYPTSNPQGCKGGTALWTAIVFDRTQLTEKTTAPENSPACFFSGAELTQWLQTLPAGDLVIAGTNNGYNADLPFDTSSIGGNSYQLSISVPAVAGYMIIGATGATPGTAYESRFAAGLTGGQPQAFGILQEDSGGNYNFLPGEVIRYVVMPNAPAGAFHVGSVGSAIQMSATQQQLSTDATHTYRSYTPAAGADGYWLLTLNRATLEPLVSCAGQSSGGNVLFQTGCGKFYPTNSTTHDAATSQAAYEALSQDLAAANKDPWQLVFLTTVGNATCCDYLSAASAGGTMIDFSNALTALGGTMALTTYPETGWDTTLTSAYTLVTASGLGNAQSGPVAESSTVLLNDHGQTGTILGTLQRNNDAGLFTPADISQQYPAILIEAGGLDNQYVTTTVGLEQPVPWPALDANHLLSGADSITGQINAYRFLSYSLITNKYLVGASGSHLDDLHFFFTGSTATNINYHYFDPINTPWPGTSASGFTACNSVSTAPNGDDTCNFAFSSTDSISFTYNDFMAVRAQTSLEVIDLTNVLVYFLTGTTNVKDMIISGNAGVGVALTGAAATIISSDLVPQAATKQVTVSWESILGSMNGLLTIAAGVPGIADFAAPLKDAAEVPSALRTGIKIASAVSNEVAGEAGFAAGAGTWKTTTTSTPLPAKYSKFAQTVGELANGALEQQLNAGFDALVDSITSDWGRIANIGPRTVDTNDLAFFSPTQSSQETAISAANASASRQFYLSLLPTMYQVHYWHAVMANSAYGSSGKLITEPDMQYGGKPIADVPSCPSSPKSAFYLPVDPSSGKYMNVPAYTSTYAATVGGQDSTYNSDFPFSHYSGVVDQYVVAEAPTNLGAASERISVMDGQLASTLFSSSGLAIPMLQFVSPKGPMAQVWYDAGAHTDNQVIGNTPNDYIWSYVRSVQYSCESAVASGSDSSSPNPASGDTVTTLTAPGAALVGTTITLSASVKTAAGAPVTAGTVYFMEDGATFATATLVSNGTASTTLLAAAVGIHELSASFASSPSYPASDAQDQSLSIYADEPTLLLSTSATALTASSAAGAVSDPVMVAVTSSYGAVGDVTFACSGLPIGMTCNFAPAKVSVTNGSKATTTMTICSTATTGAALFATLLLLPAGMRRGRPQWRLRYGILAALSLGFLAACSGGTGHNPQPAKGTVTVLVSATLGSITKTTPLQVTLQ